MAKRRKKSEETETEAPAAQAKPAISANLLKSLLASSKKAKKDIAEISGPLGQRIAKAIEENHLHRKAFNIVKSLHPLEDEKLLECLDCLDHYLDISGLRDRAAKVQRLGLDQPADEEGDEEEDEAEPAATGRRARNVEPFPAPRGVAAEA